jgi:hypothetical protein
MLGTWGIYPWFMEHGIEMIHPEDADNFKRETASNCKVFECISESTEYITLKYNDKQFRLRSDLFKTLPAPKFNFGQSVKTKVNDIEVIITDILWHYDKEEYYYFVSAAGKKKSKRYYEHEFFTS